eukprot:TRINITY_DN21065_c0_g1_i1.p2 TRINITY_DN21065_c0_g1~~TRINITY_DN21065_c0_g1_i1.p2  ORF type:complete len:207 (+),score=75.77 TRINITY_DN21065_c0_g1_i1:45-665(+)
MAARGDEGGGAAAAAGLLRRHVGLASGEEARRVEVACRDQLGGAGRLVPTVKPPRRAKQKKPAGGVTRGHPRLVKKRKAAAKKQGAVAKAPREGVGEEAEVAVAAAERLHALWVRYITALLKEVGPADPAALIATAELLGGRMTVLRSPVLRDLHRSGVCVKETDEALHVLDAGGKVLVLPKASSAVRIAVAGEEYDVLPKCLTQR